MGNIQLLLLAAGTSSRMKQPKQLLPWGSESLIEHQIKTLLATNNSVSVVLGAYSKEISQMIKRFPIRTLINEDWKKGMGSSIAYGVQQLVAKEPTTDGILIALIDQPLLTTDHFNKMIDHFIPDKKQIVVSHSDKGWSGAPVLFDRVYFKELQKLKGNDGAKTITGKHGDAAITVDGGNLLIDIDTPEAYEQVLIEFRGAD